MSDNVKAVWAKPEQGEEAVASENGPDVSKERVVVAKAFPSRAGMDRKIKFLFDHKGTVFFRVNFHDPDNQNYIAKSHFVEVRGDKAEEWPNPTPKPRGFDYENLG
jgi:hypothetical protein